MLDGHVLRVADAQSEMAEDIRLLEHVVLVEILQGRAKGWIQAIVDGCYFEGFLRHVALQFDERVDVAAIDQFIAVDTFGLVQVETNEIVVSFDRFGLGEEDSLRRERRSIITLTTTTTHLKDIR